MSVINRDYKSNSFRNKALISCISALICLLVSSCEKTTAKYDGNYLGSVSWTSSTEYFNPPQVIQQTSTSFIAQATIYSENGDVYVDCALLCESVKLKNGKANFSCTSTQQMTGVEIITTISGQVEATGSSLYLNVSNIQEGYAGSSIINRVTSTYSGTIPKM